MNSSEIDQSDDAFDFAGNAALFEGVLSRRLMAFIIDFVVLGAIISAAAVFLFLLGIPTFGLLWLALPAILPPIAFVIVFAYVAFTTGGERSATIGMRAVGLEVRLIDGRKMYPLMAIFHAVAFYFFSTVLTPFVVLVGIITPRRRLLHDYVSGAIVVNSDSISGVT